MAKDKPFTKDVEFFEVFDETFKNHMISMFNKQIQDDYYVSGILKGDDGKWVLKMTKIIKIDPSPR